MGPGGPMMGPPRGAVSEKNKEPKPKNLKEVPGFLWRTVTKFFFRLFYIFRLVWETRPWILFLMIFMAIFNGAMPVVGSVIAARILNTLAEAYTAAQNGGEILFQGIMTLFLFQFLYLFLTRIVAQLSSIMNNIAGELVVNHVNVKIMTKAKEIDLAGYDRPDFYEKLENASREAGHRPIQILNANFTIISTVISMVSYIVILIAISPVAPLIIAAVSIPSAIINFVYRKKNFLYMRHRSKDRRQMNYYSGLMTNKDMVKEIRMFSLSETFIGRYQEVFSRYFRGLKRLFLAEGGWQILLSLLSTAVNCVLFLQIARGVWAGTYQVGDYSLYTGALTSIAGGIGTLISTTASIYEGTLFIDNMITFMNEKKTVVPSLPTPRRVTRHTAHKFEFKNVSFSYPGTERKVIDHINLTIEAGSTVVLVGLNGAGKTTLIKLLTRLYDPTEGVILLDGYDIKEYDVGELYSVFGIIFQDFGKYAVSVRENIFFGQVSKEVREEEIRRAAEQSNSADFIEALPNGYDTPLMRYFEENGVELSIGQWQKLSIARAFYSDTDVLILDEPTASLDAIAEQEIYRQFDELRKDRTTIFVSHRLSSATTADKIVVLQNGRVVETGTHAELMAAKQQYYTLFSAQAERYITQEKQEAEGEPEGSEESPAGPPSGVFPPRGGRQIPRPDREDAGKESRRPPQGKE